jgi:DNA repair exonuclease SbcCD ATPase subunit
MDLETIQRRIEQLEQSQNEIKALKVTLEDALKEDERYQEVDLETRELATKKKRIKDEIWGQPTYREAIQKIKEIKEEITDISDILNHELLEWRQQNNSDEIVGSDGAPRKLKINVRLQQLHSRGEY